MEKFNIVITGHIDHGKSTFIGRLLYDTKSLSKERIDEIISTCKGLGREFEFAYILDALSEEREGALTIDTTQVSFRANKREYVIIDTPGHKEFLKNMVSGASYAEAAILIVSAKDGIQEQTRRHAYILKLLGIKQIVVAVNKMDEVSYSQKIFASMKNDLSGLFDGFDMEMLCAIPISAKYGDNIAALSGNMKWYKKKTILQALADCKKSAYRHYFRMPVQDIYRFDNEDIIIGRICSGEIKQNDKIAVLPLNHQARVASIRISEGKKKKSASGENIGLVLKEGHSLKRGDILVKYPLPKTASKFLALTLCLKNRISRDTPYILQCATQRIVCKIITIEEQINITTFRNISADFLDEAEIGKVRIVAERPLVYEEFNELPELGRFVLRKDEEIIGVGIII